MIDDRKTKYTVDDIKQNVLHIVNESNVFHCKMCDNNNYITIYPANANVSFLFHKEKSDMTFYNPQSIFKVTFSAKDYLRFFDEEISVDEVVLEKTDYNSCKAKIVSVGNKVLHEI